VPCPAAGVPGLWQAHEAVNDLAAVGGGGGLAELALDQLARTWYATGMARVRAVRASLSQWESQPCVRRLDERLYDWNTTINALAG
jgi:hypothetical protein